MILISPSFALLLDREFNHLRKCLEVPIREKYGVYSMLFEYAYIIFYLEELFDSYYDYIHFPLYCHTRNRCQCFLLLNGHEG